MCLDKVDKKLKIPENKIGYKVMLHYKGGIFRPLFYVGRNMDIGKIYNDRKRKPIFIDDTNYPTGYHIYRNLCEAKRTRIGYEYETVVKVKFDNVVASGTEHGNSVIVARRMTLLEIIEDKE